MVKTVKIYEYRRERRNKQHEWISESYYDDDVEYWDDYCCYCFRFRDWDKDELDQGPCVNSE